MTLFFLSGFQSYLAGFRGSLSGVGHHDGHCPLYRHSGGHLLRRAGGSEEDAPLQTEVRLFSSCVLVPLNYIWYFQKRKLYFTCTFLTNIQCYACILLSKTFCLTFIQIPLPVQSKNIWNFSKVLKIIHYIYVACTLVLTFKIF